MISQLLKRRACRSGKWLLVKRDGLWWVINPLGFARPCVSWRVGTGVVKWSPEFALVA